MLSTGQVASTAGQTSRKNAWKGGFTHRSWGVQTLLDDLHGSGDFPAVKGGRNAASSQPTSLFPADLLRLRIDGCSQIDDTKRCDLGSYR